VTIDAAEILVDGPWQHRLVSANGARFHIAEGLAPADHRGARAAGSAGPLVLLLHGFTGRGAMQPDDSATASTLRARMRRTTSRSDTCGGRWMQPCKPPSSGPSVQPSGRSDRVRIMRV